MTPPFRSIRIMASLFRNLPLSGFCVTTIRALFKSESILVFLLTYDDALIPLERDRDGTEIRKGLPADIDRARREVKPTPWEFCCEEYDGIDKFFVAVGHDGLQSIIWAYDHRFPNRFLKLREGDAMLNYGLTLPRYRGKNLYPMVLQEASRVLFSEGFKRVFILVDVKNQTSIRGITKAGFRRVGRLRLLKAMGCRISTRLRTGGL